MHTRSYLVVSDPDLSNFNMKVTRIISEGWQLYGDPFIDPAPTGYVADGGRAFCQAVVRYNDNG